MNIIWLKLFFYHNYYLKIRFPIDRWLDIGEGDKRISLDLEPDKKPGQLKGMWTNDFPWYQSSRI